MYLLTTLVFVTTTIAQYEYDSFAWSKSDPAWENGPPWSAHAGEYPTACSYSAVSATPIPTFDAAIVGAGLSGLSAAERLIKGGRSVVILEARNRVGGRVLNVALDNGGVQEVGAEFVGPTQDRVLSLASSLGLTTYQEYNNGSDLFWNGTGTQYSSLGFPPIDETGLQQALDTILALDTMSGTINVSAPWDAPSAQVWDSQTFSSWLDSRNLSSTARSLIEIVLTSVFSTEPGEISLLYVVSYVAAAGNATESGNMLRLITTTGGAQDSRINGGTQLLAIRLAERIEAQKGKLILSTPVRRIHRSGQSYALYSDDSKVPICIAKKVVVAMSPPLASRIIYEPLLPASRDQLTQRMPMGAIGKAIAIYGTPFWREAGLSGQVVSTDTRTTVRASFDNSPANASYGAMMGFIEADEMRRLDAVDAGEVRSTVLSDFVRYFGEEAGKPTEFVLQRWDLEEWSRGAPVAFGPPGVLTKYGYALRQPVGGIHWAGTETSDYWVGYMDGAIRSGERVAKEILNS